MERVRDGYLQLEHVDGVKQRADLSTKVHAKIRLYTLLKMWRFENLAPEAEALVLAKLAATQGL